MLHRRRFAEKLTVALATILCTILFILSLQPYDNGKKILEYKMELERMKPPRPAVNYASVSVKSPYPIFLSNTQVHYKTDDVKEDFLETPRIFTFLKNFKNPCFFENECGCEAIDMTLRCLPYFHIVGFPKTGSTDFWSQLMVHPDIVKTKKESNYWTYGRYNRYAKKLKLMRSEGQFKSNYTIGEPIPYQQPNRNLKKYLDRMNNGSRALLKEIFRSNGGKVNKIFGEGSVTYAYSSLGLRSAIGSVISKPPEEVDGDIGKVLSWLTPQTRIIFSLRNPVDRLYSDYRNLYNGLRAEEKSKENFHSVVEERIEKWKECTKNHTQEYCVASPMFEVIAVHTPVIGLVRGMYSIFIRQWKKSFPSQQMHFVRLEDRSQEMESLQNTFKFLGLRPLDARELDSLSIKMKSKKSRYPAKLKNHQVGKGEPMMEKTRKLLEDFYRPFNNDLAKLIGDSRYLWSNG